MFHQLGDLVAHYGYAIVILFILGEGIGIPLPGETVLVVAAALAAKGRLSIAGVIAAGTIGALLGGSAGFWIGRVGGQALLRRQSQRLLGLHAIERAERFFRRFGLPSVFLARFVTVLRTVVPMLAGAGHMSFARFSLYNALGGIVWAASFGGAGHFFGRTMRDVPPGLGRTGLVLLVLALLLAGVVLLARRLGQRSTRDGLPIHLGLGFVASLACAALLIAISEPAFDRGLAYWLAYHRSAGGEAISVWFSSLGGPWAMGTLASVVGLALATARRWVECGGWVVALAGAGLLNAAFTVLGRYRLPVEDVPLAALRAASAHMVVALVVYGMLAYLILRRTTAPAMRIMVVVGWGLLVAAIATSRVYLGVHAFSDVVAGCGAGSVWLAACITAFEVVRRPTAVPVPGHSGIDSVG